MQPAGAFLALWNDIAPHREAEYDQWHTLEHVPERVSVEGFLGARRYVNRERTSHRYFTLYQTRSVDVFSSAEYLDLLANPTPWSASMRPDFSHFVRAVCAVKKSSGTGIGAALACLCVPVAASDDAVSGALSLASTLPRVNAVRCGRKAETGLSLPFSAPPADSAPLRQFDRIALLEALDREAAEAALQYVKEALEIESLPRDFGADVYDLAFVFPGADPEERLRHRRAGWSRPAS